MSQSPLRVSRYEIKGLIARGGMGDLYLALDPNTSRLVVVKLLAASLNSSDIRERFEREARALASLNHPNIVDIYDYGDFQGAPFIVMKYVRGETLAEQIKRRAPVSVWQKLTWIVELCAGLQHAHEAGIVHRDIKPANLMVDQDAHLKILDFGIARMGESNLTRIASSLTHVMQIGTPGYMSPEQMDGTDIDPRADIFAVGAVCYELLAYRPAFPGANSREVEVAVVRGQPTPLVSLVPELDPEIGALLSRALAKERNDRYQDAASLGQAIEGYRARLGASEKPPASVAPPPIQGQSPVTRADAAYQRAVSAEQNGGREAARRFALEALAENPAHADARALLDRLQAGRSAPRPTAASHSAPPVKAPPAAAETVMMPPLRPRPGAGAAASPSSPETFVVNPGPPARRPASAPPAEPSIVNPPRRPANSVPPTETFDANQLHRPASPPPAKTTVANPPNRPTNRPRPTETFAVNPPHRPANPPPPAETLIVNPSHRPAIPPPPAETIIMDASRLGSAPARLAESVFDPTHLPVGSADKNPVPVAAQRTSKAPPPAASQRPSAGVGRVRSGWMALWPRRQARPQAANRPVARSATPTNLGRVAGIAAAVVVLLGAAVFGAIRFSGWMWPSGQLLTITKPQGGTITGTGVRCGSGGSDCSTSRPTGEPVELEAKADAGFVFSGFTGDCAPTGRMLMSVARTCGATFDSITTPPPPTGYLLTITPPKGGTIMSAGIQCGTLGTECSTTVPIGVPVALHVQADSGFNFLNYTDDCAPSGQTLMTGPRTCSATFAPSGGQVDLGGSKNDHRPPAPLPKTAPPAPVTAAATTTSVPVTDNPQKPPETAPVVIVPPKPADDPISPEQHAKNEIPGVLKAYCTAYEGLDPNQIKVVYPTVQERALREQFRQYKSLRCMLDGMPEYVQLDAVAGTAKVEIGWKQTIEMISGGAPKKSETIATITLSRPELRSLWRIVGVAHRQKPPA